MNKFQILKDTIIENSDANNFDRSLVEWRVNGYSEDDECDGVCICTKTGLRHLFSIKNQINGNELFPIGSVCIDHFRGDNEFSKWVARGDVRIRSGKFAGQTFLQRYNDEGWIKFLRQTHLKRNQRGSNFKAFLAWLDSEPLPWTYTPEPEISPEIVPVMTS